MADSLVTGFDGSSLCLDYPGTSLVLMTTPCPYALWDLETVSSSYWSDFTYVNGVYTLTANAFGERYPTNLTCELFDLLMLSTEVGGTKKLTINAALTKSANVYAASATITPIINGTNATALNLDADATASGTLAVPYYRYRLNCAMVMTWEFPYAVEGDWAELTITLS